MKLFAVGYKYCKRKCLCFLFTEDALWTEEGELYKAQFKYSHGNSMIRDVLRPVCCSHYFKISNVVDVNNQQRQRMRLGKIWVTQDGYFRIITTVFGMCVVDCWNSYRHHLHQKHRQKDCDLISMVNMVAKDLLDKKENYMIEVDSSSLCIVVGPVQDIDTGQSSVLKVSQFTEKSSATASELKDSKLHLQVDSHMMVPCNDQTDAKSKERVKKTGREIVKNEKRKEREVIPLNTGE